MRKKVLLLGGCGFIGSHLADVLLNKGYQVILFDRKNINLKNVIHLKGKIDVIEGDFLNEIDLRKAIEGMDYIVHLVYSTLPFTSIDNIVYDVETNVIGSIKLLNLMRENKNQKIIFISSGGTIYGKAVKLPLDEYHMTNPISSYGITKLVIEKYLFLFKHISNINYLILRLSNLYGERYDIRKSQGIINVFLNKIKNGEDIIIYGDGNNIRDYIYIKDFCEAFIRLIDQDINNEILNIGSGIGYSINDVVKNIKEVVNKNFKVKYINDRGIDVGKNVLNIDKIRKKINWAPQVKLKDGIKSTWEWEKNEK